MGTLNKKEGINNRLKNIDYLRGIAVFGVCLVHFTVPTPIFKEYTLLREICHYGKYGVELFFLISGFIIPYSMNRQDYKMNSFFRFLSRRLIRIEIPYLVNIAFVLILGYLATLHPLYKGIPFEIEIFNLAAHLGYLNIFFDNKWVNPVFWTLAIEFHFYLTVAVIFPFLFKGRKYRVIVYVVLLFPLFITSTFSIIRFYGYFILGITAFLFYINKINKTEAFLTVVILTLYIVYFRGWFNLAVIGTFLYFVFWGDNIFSRFFGYLGKISFSLYLYHFVGGKVQNLGINYIEGEYFKLILIPVAFIASIALGHIMYYTVERFSLNMARKIKYKSNSVFLEQYALYTKK